jgi:hypothetical protein
MTRPLNRAAVNGFLGGSEVRTKKLNRRALSSFKEARQPRRRTSPAVGGEAGEDGTLRLR